MSKETTALLRTMLLQANKAKSVNEMRLAIEAMCEKDDIDAVRQSLAELIESEQN